MLCFVFDIQYAFGGAKWGMVSGNFCHKECRIESAFYFKHPSSKYKVYFVSLNMALRCGSAQAHQVPASVV